MNIWLERLNSSEAHTLFTLGIRNENREFFKNAHEITLEQHKKWISKTLKDDRMNFYIIYENDSMIGTISLKLGTSLLIGEIGNVCIDKQHRGKGKGTRALTLVERLAKNRKLVTVYLSVMADNPGAIEFYTANGYKLPKDLITLNKAL